MVDGFYFYMFKELKGRVRFKNGRIVETSEELTKLKSWGRKHIFLARDRLIKLEKKICLRKQKRKS